MEKLRDQLLADKSLECLFYDYPANKHKVVETELYKAIYNMQKGRLLHTHSGSTFDMRYALDLALRLDETRIYLSTDGKFEYGTLMYLPQMNEDVKLLDGWKTVSEAEKMTGNVKELLINLYTVGVNQAQTIDEAWEKFEKIFQRTWSLYCYLPVFEPLYIHSCKQMIDEGITAFDYRTLLFEVSDKDGRKLTDAEKVQKMIDLTQEVKKECKEFEMHIIYCCVKSDSAENIRKAAEKAEELMKLFPETVIGFDLVGEETLDNQLSTSESVLRDFDLPFILHAGEHTSKENINIEKALELEAKRLGHAYNLYQMKPEILEEIRKRQMVLEVCPISNQVLGYCRDLREHPAKEYISKGLKVAIASDDHELFGTNYMTDDLFIAFLAWGLSTDELQQLINNSQ